MQDGARANVRTQRGCDERTRSRSQRQVLSRLPSNGRVSSKIAAAFLLKFEVIFNVGHSNDKKHSHKNEKQAARNGQWAAACAHVKVEPVSVVLGGEMRATNAIDLACLKSACPESNENVYSLGLKQDESSRLRRIENLKCENALLMRMVEETRIEIVRLRDLLSAV